MQLHHLRLDLLLNQSLILDLMKFQQVMDYQYYLHHNNLHNLILHQSIGIYLLTQTMSQLRINYLH